MKKNKNWFFVLTFLAGLFSVTVAFAEEVNFTQQEVADFIKPGVVKIVQHVKGSAVIPAVAVDFKNMTIATKEDVAPQNVNIDEYFTGSGAIVSPDGYIITNSHVVSSQTIKNLIVSDYVYRAIDDGYAKLSEEEIGNINDGRNSAQMSEFGNKIADYILSVSKFDIAKTVSVLNPSSQKENFADLVSEGFTAEIVSINDDYFRDSRDVALIKISQQNLPAVTLGDSGNVSTGKKVYIFGYPSTAEINEKDLLEPTFTQGTISATKDSPNGDFKIFQTDAKISKGSSGGPLLDERGEVVGLITFITSDFIKDDGDSFAFAIPINEAKKIIAENATGGNIPGEFQAGNYAKHFLTGLNFLKSAQCRQAITEFKSAGQSNDSFGVANNLEPYIKQCEETIAAGKSVDSFWEIVKFRLGDAKYLVIVASLLGLILIAALFAAWYWLFRRIKKDEEELDNVEDFLDLNLEDGTPRPEPLENDEKSESEKNDEQSLKIP